MFDFLWFSLVIYRELKVGQLENCGTNMETEKCPEPVPIPDTCVECLIEGIPYSNGQEIPNRGGECSKW